MRELLIATKSKGKIKELVNELKKLPFKIVSLADLQDGLDDFKVEEPATTFEGNAIIKAIKYGSKLGLLALADDSGLEVDALGGNPGVLTARYAEGTDKDRYVKLLKELEGVESSKRTARFRSVIAIYDPKSGRIRTCEGIYDGYIALMPKGDNGFGYDPIFYNPKLKKMNSEMSLEEKNSVSHRGQALRKAAAILKGEF